MIERSITKKEGNSQKRELPSSALGYNDVPVHIMPGLLRLV
jgi:hypothetical protein